MQRVRLFNLYPLMKYLVALIFNVCFVGVCLFAQELPREWVDTDTGHRIVRLSDEAGSSSFYFHQNAYTADGDKLIFSTPRGLSTYNFKSKKIEQIVDGRAGSVIVGRK